MQQVVYVLMQYYDYNRTAIVKIVSTEKEAKAWEAKNLCNVYESFIVDE